VLSNASTRHAFKRERICAGFAGYCRQFEAATVRRWQLLAAEALLRMLDQFGQPARQRSEVREYVGFLSHLPSHGN
jgi:hypothetical protein